jgi:hypothetical protein
MALYYSASLILQKSDSLSETPVVKKPKGVMIALK